MVPRGGLEPPLPCENRVLNPARLPFHHLGILKHRTGGLRSDGIPASTISATPLREVGPGLEPGRLAAGISENRGASVRCFMAETAGLEPAGRLQTDLPRFQRGPLAARTRLHVVQRICCATDPLYVVPGEGLEPTKSDDGGVTNRQLSLLHTPSGADGETRTRTTLRPPDFESSTSTIPSHPRVGSLTPSGGREASFIPSNDFKEQNPKRRNPLRPGWPEGVSVVLFWVQKELDDTTSGTHEQ
jgi:hypothetical protein